MWRIPIDNPKVVGLAGHDDDVGDLQFAPDARHIGKQDVVVRPHLRNGEISVGVGRRPKQIICDTLIHPVEGSFVAENHHRVGRGLTGFRFDCAGDCPALARINIFRFVDPGVRPVGHHQRGFILRILPKLQVVGSRVGIHEKRADHFGEDLAGGSTRIGNIAQTVAFKVIVIHIVTRHGSLLLGRSAVHMFKAGQNAPQPYLIRGQSPDSAEGIGRSLVAAIIILGPRRLEVGSQTARLGIGRPARLVICPSRLCPRVGERQYLHFAGNPGGIGSGDIADAQGNWHIRSRKCPSVVDTAIGIRRLDKSGGVGTTLPTVRIIISRRLVAPMPPDVICIKAGLTGTHHMMFRPVPQTVRKQIRVAGCARIADHHVGNLSVIGHDTVSRAEAGRNGNPPIVRAAADMRQAQGIVLAGINQVEAWIFRGGERGNRAVGLAEDHCHQSIRHRDRAIAIIGDCDICR